LQVTQLQRDRLLRYHSRRLHQLFGGLALTLRVDDLRSSVARGVSLSSHGALHDIRQHHVLDFNGCDFYAPRFCLTVNNLLETLIDFSRCESSSSNSACPITLRNVV